MSSNKSDRSMSPSTLSEEGRRELIARQHRALYGNEAPGFQAYSDDGSNPAAVNAPPPSAGRGPRGTSPRGMDPFGMPSSEGNTQSQESNRMEKPSSSSPSSGTAPPQQFKAPTPPAGEEGHSRNISKSTTAPAGGMGPIGSRPSQAPSQGVNKRSTTPLYNFGRSEEHTSELQSPA